MMKKVKGNAYIEIQKKTARQLNYETGRMDFSDQYRAIVKMADGTYRIAGPYTTDIEEAKQSAIVSAS